MYLFGKSLISKYLFFLEHFSCETNFHFNNSLFIYNSTFGSAVIYKEFLVINQYSFPLLYITHKPTIKVGIEIVQFEKLKSFLFMCISLLMFGIIFPYRCYSHYLYSFWCWGINLNFSWSMINSTEEGSRIFYIEFIFLKFKNLVLMNIEFRIGFKERLDCCIHDSSSWIVQSS